MLIWAIRFIFRLREPWLCSAASKFVGAFLSSSSVSCEYFKLYKSTYVTNKIESQSKTASTVFQNWIKSMSSMYMFDKTMFVKTLFVKTLYLLKSGPSQGGGWGGFSPPNIWQIS